MEEIVVGKPIIQTFGLEETTTRQVNILNDNLFKSMRSAAFTSQLVEPLVKFLNQLPIASSLFKAVLWYYVGPFPLGIFRHSFSM